MPPASRSSWRTSWPPKGCHAGWGATVTGRGRAIDWGIDPKTGQAVINREGESVQMELSRPVKGGQWAIKDWWAKAMLSPVDLAGARTKSGGKIDVVAPVKDWQGAVHSLFQAEWAQADETRRAQIAGEVGVPVEQLTNYSQSGKAIYEAFGRQQNPLLSRYVTTGSWEQVIHQSQLGRYQHLISQKSEAPDIGQGFYRATLSAPGLYSPTGVATRVMQEYNNRRVLVNPLELERMRRAEELPGGIPGQAAHLQQISNVPRQRARGLIQAYQANQEPGLIPSNAIDLATPQGQGIVAGALAQAGQDVRARATEPFAEGENPSPRLLVKPFFEALAKGTLQEGEKSVPIGRRMLSLPTEGGQLAIASASAMLGSSASGRYLEHGLETEASPLLTSAFDTITGYMGGGAASGTDKEGQPITQEENIAAYKAALEETASAPDTRRIAEGALLPRREASGRKLLGSSALAPGEAYVPGMGGNAVQITGNPTGGTPDYMAGLLQYSISAKEAQKRGMDPGQMYAPGRVATAHGPRLRRRYGRCPQRWARAKRVSGPGAVHVWAG